MLNAATELRSKLLRMQDVDARVRHVAPLVGHCPLPAFVGPRRWAQAMVGSRSVYRFKSFDGNYITSDIHPHEALRLR